VGADGSDRTRKWDLTVRVATMHANTNAGYGLLPYPATIAANAQDSPQAAEAVAGQVYLAFS